MNPLENLDEIEWGTFPAFNRRFNIGRTLAYQLRDEGVLESRLVRRKGSGAGRRLWSFDSARRFLAGCPSEPTKATVRHLKRCAAESVKVRKAKAAAKANGRNGLT